MEGDGARLGFEELSLSEGSRGTGLSRAICSIGVGFGVTAGVGFGVSTGGCSGISTGGGSGIAAGVGFGVSAGACVWMTIAAGVGCPTSSRKRWS